MGRGDLVGIALASYLEVPGSNRSSATSSARTFLGKEFTHIAQVNSAFYLNWKENKYQLSWGLSPEVHCGAGK